jgi:ribosomal protein S18 acetylase RimI-like enzyme
MSHRQNPVAGGRGNGQAGAVQQDGVQVRRAHPDEWAAVRDVRLAALADAPDAFASTLAREEGRTEAEWRSRVAQIPWFLAWQAGCPAGLVAMFPLIQEGSEGPAHPVAEWHLVSMWVPPAARGGGIADRLVGAVLAHARAAGAERVTLWVATGNARATAFYRRMGFRPTGRHQRYPRPGAAALDEAEFIRELPGAPAASQLQRRP